MGDPSLLTSAFCDGWTIDQHSVLCLFIQQGQGFLPLSQFFQRVDVEKDEFSVLGIAGRDVLRCGVKGDSADDDRIVPARNPPYGLGSVVLLLGYRRVCTQARRRAIGRASKDAAEACGGASRRARRIGGYAIGEWTSLG